MKKEEIGKMLKHICAMRSIILAGAILLELVSGLDFMAHVEEKLMAMEDNKHHEDTIRELEEVFAYGDKSRFKDMFFDLNKFYANDITDSANKIKISTTKESKTGVDSRTKSLQPEFLKQALVTSTESQRDNNRGEHLKSVDDNPLDLQLRRLYGDIYDDDDYDNSEFKEYDIDANYQNVVTDIRNRIPKIDQDAVDWKPNEPEPEYLSWSESRIRQGIGKKHEGGDVQEKISPAFSTTEQPYIMQMGFPNFNALKLKEKVKEKFTPKLSSDGFKSNENIVKDIFSSTTTSPSASTTTTEYFRIKFHEPLVEKSTATASTTPAVLKWKKHKRKETNGKFRRRKRIRNGDRAFNARRPFKLLKESEYKEKEFKVVEDLNQKVSGPMEEEWVHIFQPPTSSSFPETTISSTSSQSPVKDQDQDSGFIKQLVSRYCDIENTIGILQLCNSKTLSKTRKSKKSLDQRRKGSKFLFSEHERSPSPGSGILGSITNTLATFFI